MSEYTFDCKFFASIAVTATSEAEARRKLEAMFGDCTANLGNIDGNPIVAVLDHDGEDDLIEIDGKCLP